LVQTPAIKSKINPSQGKGGKKKVKKKGKKKKRKAKNRIIFFLSRVVFFVSRWVEMKFFWDPMAWHGMRGAVWQANFFFLLLLN